MGSGRLAVSLFCEDHGHEQFARALLNRIAREEHVRLSLRTQNSAGGHGKAISQFRAWQRLLARGLQVERPDLLVLMIDGNCSAWQTARKVLEQAIDEQLFSSWVIGCPEPHVERWCFADPDAFRSAIGVSPPPDPGKCERRIYKHLLRTTIETAGRMILTDEMEFAPDIVRKMDLYHAGKRQRSLGHFVDSLRPAIRSGSRQEAQDGDMR